MNGAAQACLMQHRGKIRDLNPFRPIPALVAFSAQGCSIPPFRSAEIAAAQQYPPQTHPNG